MKFFGYFFFIVGLYQGVNLGKDAYKNLMYEHQSVVVKGTISEVDSNLDEGLHWRYEKVYLYVTYPRKADSLATVKVECHKGVDHLSCGEVGDKKFVRLIPDSVKNKIQIHPYIDDYVQVNDDGVYELFAFSWSSFFIPIGFLFIGFVTLRIGSWFR